MAVRSVRIESFRCFDTVDFELDPRATLFNGPNASGKTSLLEAIFLLGRGRSFRAPRLDSAIRHGQSRLAVSGTIDHGASEAALRIEYSNGQTAAHFRSEPLPSLAQLSAILPVQVIDPGIHKLVEEGPQRRRRLMDWGTFHVEPAFLSTWQRFYRALQQRNTALQQRAIGDLDAWDSVLVGPAEEVAAIRARYLQQSLPYLEDACENLTGSAVSITYCQGWPNQGLATAIERARATDYRRRTTTLGPHRADLLIEVCQRSAKTVVSRGQQKLLAAGLILGQLEYHIARHGLRPTLLLDDPAAELDGEAISRFAHRAFGLAAQLVLTSLPGSAPSLINFNREFHVEQGRVKRVL
ncbi:MAG TPA: DNA replication and repair protein RecF [Blastocatellia bacterium]|nr:DNA replication and repair protein RecF [Blastocatellia bacterium]